MTLGHSITLSFAAALFAVGFAASASAATTTTHHPVHATHVAHGRGHAAPATDADHSADSLNAQSLSRAQGATQ